MTLGLLEVKISKYIQLLVKDDHGLDNPGKKSPSYKTKGTKMTVTTRIQVIHIFNLSPRVFFGKYYTSL